MLNSMSDHPFSWQGKRVFLTGHTGFKGGWLALWLSKLGADVRGYALAPSTEPNLFTVARVGAVVDDIRGDIRNAVALESALRDFAPEVVFHLAAQPLVRLSYDDPILTYETNVIGTARVLDAIRRTPTVRAVVVITTDKCYENKEWVWPYRETDRLGGHDPYSNSKACSELVVSAYRSSFFSPALYDQHGLAIASARAGNVIGGGDWAEDRLVPDTMRAFAAKEVLTIRNPHAVRPWQHVLEPLAGYLTLAQRLFESGMQYGDAWNFGPEYSDALPVEWIVRELAADWDGDVQWQVDDRAHPYEAQILKLDCSKALHALGWRPSLRLKQALLLTADWYRRWNAGEDARAITNEQIEKFVRISKENVDTLRP